MPEQIEVVDNKTGKILFRLVASRTAHDVATYSLDDGTGLIKNVSIYHVPADYSSQGYKILS